MILLHLLLAVAFILLFLQTRRVDKLQKAFATQEDINDAVLENFLIVNKKFEEVGESLAKKSNKRTKK